MDFLQHQLPVGSLSSGQPTPQLSLNDPVPHSGNAGSTTTRVERKKFAKPPVKNACLSCRGSRIRCDGQQPCVNCTEKHKDCKYEKSKRGGPRVPSSRKRPETRNPSAEDDVKQEPLPPLPLTIEDQFLVAAELREAGAGLRFLDDVDEHMGFMTAIDRFDNCGANAWDDCGISTIPDVPEEVAAFDYEGTLHWDTVNEFSVADENVPSEVRSYDSEADILDAYYVWIHPYFPVLPPPLRAPVDHPRTRTAVPNEWTPSTPITLALSAILALIPLPDDPNARSSQSTWDRRFQAQQHAQAAFIALDEESEMIDSTLNPKDALSNGPSSNPRKPFHRQCPVDLEENVTLMLLAVYEYTQRGNVKKMMTRGSASFTSAKSKRLFEANPWNDEFAEARRRVWWSTYINVCQGSIASNSACALDIHDPDFTIPYPTIQADPEAFPFFIQCQQAIVEATQYVIDHTKALKEYGDLSVMYARTIEMENRLAELSKIADAWFTYDRSPVDQPVDQSEAVVAKALRAIARMKINSARIKIHRYSAFIDEPIFQKRHCDLIPTNLPPQQHQNGNSMMPSPSGTNTNSSSSRSNSQFSPSNREGSTGSANTPKSGYGSSSASASDHSHAHSHQQSIRSCSSEISPMCSIAAQGGPALANHLIPTLSTQSVMPYDATYSAQQCCKSAIDIAETFAMLPYPNPSGFVQARNPVYNPADPLNPRNLTSTNYASPFGLPDMSGVGALNGGVGLNKNGGLDFSAIARQQSQHPPRTMPTFACCAMQAAYALLMGLYGVYMKRQQGQLGDMPGEQFTLNGGPKPYGVREREIREHVEKLREGLGGVVAALENWAGAFEAIDGMREEVSNALEFNVVTFEDLGPV